MLGVLSGCVAAIAVLPTALPLTQRMAVVEQALAERRVEGAAKLAAQAVARDGTLDPGSRLRLGVSHLHLRSPGGLILAQDGPDLPPLVDERACSQAGQPITVNVPVGPPWSAECTQVDAGELVAAWQPDETPGTPVLYLVALLAAIVGIVTALGILRLLSPLSRLSKAIVRVGAGERGVRVPTTGLGELDELVDRVNSAAQAMEAREDAIMARIKAVQDMAQLVAHEVRNPLQSLELLTSLIASEDDANERAELAGAIHAEIRALDMVVTRVLREGAPGGTLRLHRARASLKPLVDQVIALRLPEARAHGVRLEKGPCTSRQASMDAALIGRSIENLVLNALQAVRPQNGVVRISIVDEGGSLAIIVEDNGLGVDPALAEHVFEPNVTGRTGGTGLGLALVREVMHAHHGYIGHDRSPLGGARFTARIPIDGATQ